MHLPLPYFQEPLRASRGRCPHRPVLRVADRYSGTMRAKAPLADQGWCSAQRIKILMIASGNHTIIHAAPVRTLGLRGSELPSFCVLSLTQFDNPSVKNQRFLPAVHCGMTATGSHGNFDSLRGAPPLTQGSLGCSRTSAFIDASQKNRKIVPHSFLTSYKGAGALRTCA